MRLIGLTSCLLFISGGKPKYLFPEIRYVSARRKEKEQCLQDFHLNLQYLKIMCLIFIKFGRYFLFLQQIREWSSECQHSCTITSKMGEIVLVNNIQKKQLQRRFTRQPFVGEHNFYFAKRELRNVSGNYYCITHHSNTQWFKTTILLLFIFQWLKFKWVGLLTYVTSGRVTVIWKLPTWFIHIVFSWYCLWTRGTAGFANQRVLHVTFPYRFGFSQHGFWILRGRKQNLHLVGQILQKIILRRSLGYKMFIRNQHLR